ncbi:hypothetical protein [Saccharicrinis aurantiacus]|uniref:hypothetical protein n=1 Tax=Saccharicrinis aurantiacus TaxID=1849719 RepID=UPI000838589B|nr:hypothetical protein [Saccharicrinis aurantiacus]
MKNIEICKGCTNKKLDIERGLMCGLTNDKPNFVSKCGDFIPVDESYKDVANKILAQDEYLEPIRNEEETESDSKQDDSLNQRTEEKQIKSAASWFFWIAGLTLMNSIYQYLDCGQIFIFGVGLNQIIEAALYESSEVKSILFLIPSILTSGIFVLIGVKARKKIKGAFLAGLIIYSIDSLLYLSVGGYLSFGLHCFVLFMVYKTLEASKLMTKEQVVKQVAEFTRINRYK